ncbi:Acetyltransferase (GNAT) family [Seminavis robusta]|uniref:Acetyltransferase (GNAT) family n=1 Tax=Seminavis robusta TaxID=568900 RepID=A0A9N8HBP4_9STRA|nr:Acetyltransferase (GNAT) family [Seminavis robusta]|eukprot:Sro268_g103760.1 Acetyltransferase (GNAT) family (170) ;mRNA; f:62553-63062
MSSSDLKIRNVEKSDIEHLKTVIDTSDLFPSEMLDEMIAGYFKGEESCIWLTGDDSEKPRAVAYCAPEKMTEGTWNLYLIAVHDSLQGTGIGTKIIEHLEEKLVSEKEARILLVETSGSSEFEKTRKFYENRGFVEEARIREYYQAGEDKIVFWKKLNKPADTTTNESN